MAANARNDAENLKAIEAIRPLFEKLQADRIRTEADIVRLAREYDEAKALAVEELGTSDEAEIRGMIEEARIGNTQAVDEFVSMVRAAEQRVRDVDGGGA